MRRSQARSQEAIEFAKSQRARANEFSSTVWQWLRNRQCHGQKFRREFPIPPYTADFCCVELQLIIEIDGEPHTTAAGRAHDASRDQFLKELGYEVLRVPGYGVLREAGTAFRQIEAAVKSRMEEVSRKTTPHPQPLSPRRGEGRQK